MDDTNNTASGPAQGEGGAPAPPPPQPPPPSAQPTAPPPTGAPAQGAVPAQEPKSNKMLLVILLVIAALILCGVGSCVIGGVTLFSNQQNKDDLITEAEVHMDAAVEILEQVDADWETFGATGSDQTTDAYAQIQTTTQESIDEAKAELDTAQKNIEELPDSTFKTEYTFAIGAFNQSLDAYELLYSSLGELMALSNELDTLGTQIDEASNTLDDAVSSNNDDAYSSGKSDAEAAKKSFETIAARYDALAAANPDAELGKMAAIARKQAEKAGYVLQAADAGKAGRTSAYNDLTDKYNDANEAAKEMPLPYWAADSSLLVADAEALYDEAWDLALQAQDSWELALAAYNAGDY